jgi:hypothetical protein
VGVCLFCCMLRQLPRVPVALWWGQGPRPSPATARRSPLVCCPSHSRRRVQWRARDVAGPGVTSCVHAFDSVYPPFSWLNRKADSGGEHSLPSWSCSWRSCCFALFAASVSVAAIVRFVLWLCIGCAAVVRFVLRLCIGCAAVVRFRVTGGGSLPLDLPHTLNC